MIDYKQIKLINYVINPDNFRDLNNFKELLNSLITSKHKLHVFPEFFLLPLIFFYETDLKNEALSQQVKKYIWQHKKEILSLIIKHTPNLNGAFLIHRTQKIISQIIPLFAKLAHKNKTFIYTWTWFSPFWDWEPIKNWYMPLGHNLLNTWYLFGETGMLLGTSTKQRITLQEKKFNITPNPWLSNVFETSIWKLGIFLNFLLPLLSLLLSLL